MFHTPKNGTPHDFLRHAFIDGQGEFGYRNHIVGILDDKVVAIGGGWSGKTGFAFMLAGARQILSHYGLMRGAAVILRGLRTETVIPPPSSKQFYLGQLGVQPALQSHGIGKQLIQHLIEQGIHQGFTLAALDVSEKNPRGQALYERLGFIVTKERQSTLINQFGFVPNHRHMQLSIASSQ